MQIVQNVRNLRNWTYHETMFQYHPPMKIQEEMPLKRKWTNTVNIQQADDTFP